MDLLNQTPFAAERHLYLDQTGRERLLVVVKGTWSLSGPKPEPAKEQVPVAVADTYRGDPVSSSLLEACDLVPEKPATDVLVLGFAYTTPANRSEVLAAMRLGSIQKGVRVKGDRCWKRTLGFASPTPPEPFAKVEIIWERAFGGTDRSVPERIQFHEDNPVGIGYRGRGSSLPIAGAPLPNLEDPANPLGSPGGSSPSVGFGPVAPHWRPRARYAGTYDEAWRRSRYPLLPEDFDRRFYQVAPPDQIHPGHVRGGEPVKVVGMTPQGAIAFALPRLEPRVLIQAHRTDMEMPPGRCDTVIVNCEHQTVSVVWRSSAEVHGKVARLRQIDVETGDSDAG